MISEQTIFSHFAGAQLCRLVMKMQRRLGDVHFCTKILIVCEHHITSRSKTISVADCSETTDLIGFHWTGLE